MDVGGNLHLQTSEGERAGGMARRGSPHAQALENSREELPWPPPGKGHGGSPELSGCFLAPEEQASVERQRVCERLGWLELPTCSWDLPGTAPHRAWGPRPPTAPNISLMRVTGKGGV